MPGKHGRGKQKGAGCIGRECTMEQMTKDQEAIVDFIPPEALLPSLGIRQGKKIKIMAFSSFGGPVIVAVGGRSIAIGRSLASKIKLIGAEDAATS
ncbi:ferrous iron transport protein A [Peptococcaceae bacterium]|nr:ferrous iron transport protein A [Peptococcaceae bacterium]